MNTVPTTPIQRIFRRLAVTYGSAWDRYIGDIPPEDIIRLWEYELNGYLQSESGITTLTWALDNLPERCPNIIEFRALCRRVPANTFQILPEPPANPAVIAAALSKTNLTLENKGSVDWARRIVSRFETGEKVNYQPLKMAYGALGIDLKKPACEMKFKQR